MFRSYGKNILRQIAIWVPAMVFFAGLRTIGVENNELQQQGPLFILALTCIVGTVAGTLFGALETFSDRYLMYRLPWGKMVLLGIVAFFIIFFIIMLTAIIVFLSLTEQPPTPGMLIEAILSGNGLMMMLYIIIVGFMVDLFRIMDRKFGPGNLWRILRGEYYSPREDTRIFMFLDMKSSTMLAEKLGHIRYSQLIKDCFDDLSVVIQYKAEIYQYVGDEVVLTWSLHDGLTNLNCLRAYTGFMEKIHQRSQYYQDRYEVVPVFKAGINSGRVVITEVGQIKREIAYHGDTINTAARIQTRCNELNSTLLLSESLKNILPPTREYQFEHVGEEVLKGKSEEIALYSARHAKVQARSGAVQDANGQLV